MRPGKWFPVAYDAGNGGYNVVDSRDGRSVAWRYRIADAAAVAASLNASYPPLSIPPAFDTLVFEVGCLAEATAQ